MKKSKVAIRDRIAEKWEGLKNTTSPFVYAIIGVLLFVFLIWMSLGIKYIYILYFLFGGGF